MTPSGDTRSAMMAIAMQALMQLPRAERGLILCWFCGECSGYIGPGKSHKCGNHDEDVDG